MGRQGWPRPTRLTPRQAEELLERWRDVPPGTPVTVRKDDGTLLETTTRSSAMALSGCYSLQRVTLRQGVLPLAAAAEAPAEAPPVPPAKPPIEQIREALAKANACVVVGSTDYYDCAMHAYYLQMAAWAIEIAEKLGMDLDTTPLALHPVISKILIEFGALPAEEAA